MFLGEAEVEDPAGDDARGRAGVCFAGPPTAGTALPAGRADGPADADALTGAEADADAVVESIGGDSSLAGSSAGVAVAAVAICNKGGVLDA
jgi:hypothetical protein